MFKKLALVAFAALLGTATLTSVSQPADAKVRVNVGVGYPAVYPRYGYGYYQPYYHPYYHPYYAYRPYYPPPAYRYAPYPRYAYSGGSHVQRCLARYRTYNPATDLYFARPGVAVRCRL